MSDRLRNFSRFFRDEQVEAEQGAVDRARMVLDWVSQEYHPKFEEWLEREASKPMDISAQHMDLVKSAVRANTLKEIREYLGKLRKGAMAAMERAKGVSNG